VLLTPSPHLDRALSGGLYPGHLYVIAGYPGSGASTLVLQVMNHAASSQRAQCVFIGLQRGVEDLFKRSLSYLGRIPVWEIDEKRQNPKQLYEDKDFHRRIFAAFERYQQFADNITILEGAAAGNLNRLVQILREKKEELRQKSSRGGSVLLIVDNLQLMVAMIRAMRPDRGSEMELAPEGLQWTVETLTSRLKALARELDVTVLATFEHQLTHRSIATERTDADPAMQRLYFDTQFADTVMLQTRQGSSLLNLRDYFKAQFSDTPQESRIESINDSLNAIEKSYRQTQEFQALRSEFAVLDIIKNRNGPRDKILFISHKPTSHFEPLDYANWDDHTGTSPLASAAT
jgi:replicative DNA helicase